MGGRQDDDKLLGKPVISGGFHGIKVSVSGESLKKEGHGRCLRKTEQSKELQVGQSELT